MYTTEPDELQCPWDWDRTAYFHIEQESPQSFQLFNRSIYALKRETKNAKNILPFSSSFQRIKILDRFLNHAKAADGYNLGFLRKILLSTTVQHRS